MAGEQLEPAGAVDDPPAGSPGLHPGRGIVPVAPRLLGFGSDARLLSQQRLALAVEQLRVAMGDLEAPEEPRPSRPAGSRRAIVVGRVGSAAPPCAG